jgi:hypothetical protein
LTAFVTWLKRPTAELVPLLVVCSTILLSGCIRLPGFDGAKQAEEPPVSPPVQAPKPAERLEVTGLTPLPTTDQLLASMPIGRNDPFAPQPRIGLTASPEQAASVGGQPPSSPGAQARSGATRKRPAPLPPLQLPPEFRFNGVMRAGSRPQALVQLGADIGTVCVGTRGFCAGSGLAALLPPGWTVAAIDVERGRLTLRQGSRSVTAEL